MLELVTSERSPSLPQGMEHASSFLIFFYHIHTSMTNDCVSFTKILMKGVKLMTDSHNKILT